MQVSYQIHSVPICSPVLGCLFIFLTVSSDAKKSLILVFIFVFICYLCFGVISMKCYQIQHRENSLWLFTYEFYL